MYTPSQEEIKKGEEMMIPIEKSLSQQREDMINALEKKGKTGYLELHYTNGAFGPEADLHGIINGRDFVVEHYFSLNDDEKDVIDEYSGTLFGPKDIIQLKKEDARKIFEKYSEIAISGMDMESARDEVFREMDIASSEEEKALNEILN